MKIAQSYLDQVDLSEIEEKIISENTAKGLKGDPRFILYGIRKVEFSNRKQMILAGCRYAESKTDGIYGWEYGFVDKLYVFGEFALSVLSCINEQHSSLDKFKETDFMEQILNCFFPSKTVADSWLDPYYSVPSTTKRKLKPTLVQFMKDVFGCNSVGEKGSCLIDEEIQEKYGKFLQEVLSMELGEEIVDKKDQWIQHLAKKNEGFVVSDKKISYKDAALNDLQQNATKVFDLKKGKIDEFSIKSEEFKKVANKYNDENFAECLQNSKLISKLKTVFKEKNLRD